MKKMKLFYVLCLLPLLVQGQGQIQFSGNGYSEVVVSISPDVPGDNGQAIVDGIKVSSYKKGYWIILLQCGF